MKKWMIFSVIACFSILSASFVLAGDDPFFQSACADKELRFMFFKQSSVIIKASDKTLLIDPARSIGKEVLEQLQRHGLDLLMYTHAHYDHYDYTAAMEIFAATGAHVIASPAVAGELKREIPSEKITVSSHKGRHTLNGIDVTVIKGKHIGPIYLYHINIADMRIFHGGDSSYIALSDYPADVAFVPTGDPSPTCSPQKAFKMVLDTKPQVAVAIHGSSHQNTTFKAKMNEGLPDTDVIVPVRLNPIALVLGE